MSGIKFPDGCEIKGLKEGEGYKYLGILEADEVKSREMKDKISTEYKRRVRKVLQTKINGETSFKLSIPMLFPWSGTRLLL